MNKLQKQQRLDYLDKNVTALEEDIQDIKRELQSLENDKRKWLRPYDLDDNKYTAEYQELLGIKEELEDKLDKVEDEFFWLREELEEK